MLLLQQMMAFLVFLLIGYYMRKKGIVDEKGCSSISWIVANVANPALIISGAMDAGGSLTPHKVLVILGWGMVIYAGLVLISFVVPAILRIPQAKKGVYRNIILFSNIGFMGFPLISALLGPQAVLCASIFLIPFNFLLYTMGIQNFNQAESGKKKGKSGISIFLNLGILACIVALILNFSGLKLGGFVKNTITGLANLTAALSMINIGTFLVGVKLKELVTDARLLAAAGLKMLVVPVLGTLLLQKFIPDRELLTIIMIILATPTASMVAILAEQHGGDSAFATRAVALTTLISVVTIPLIFRVLNIA